MRLRFLIFFIFTMSLKKALHYITPRQDKVLTGYHIHEKNVKPKQPQGQLSVSPDIWKTESGQSR